MFIQQKLPIIRKKILLFDDVGSSADRGSGVVQIFYGFNSHRASPYGIFM